MGIRDLIVINWIIERYEFVIDWIKEEMIVNSDGAEKIFGGFLTTLFTVEKG